MVSPASPKPPTPPVSPYPANSKRFSGGELLLNVAIALAALAGAIAIQRSQLQATLLRSPDPKQAEKQESLRLQLLKRLPTLGFDNLIADWTFLRFIQYFGDDEARSKTGYTLSAEYFDLLTQSDPRFIDIYPFLSTGVSFYMGQPKLAVQYMDRGTKALFPQIDPKAYLLWRYKALDQLLLIGDVPGSIHSHEMAAKWVEGTPDAQYAAFYRKTAEFLKKDPDSTLVRFQSWLAVYYQAVDKRVQDRAKQEILKLGGKIRSNKDGQIYFVAPEKKPSKSLPAKPPAKPK